MIERTREELVALLIEHQHSYDEDCGVDDGCSCGWGPQTQIGYDDEGREVEPWQAAAFAEHLASIIRDEPQPVVPQHEEIARLKMEEADREAAARTPEAIAEARSKALVVIDGYERNELTATVHADAKVFIEGNKMTVWSQVDTRPVIRAESSWLAALLRESLDADDPRWATRNDIPLPIRSISPTGFSARAKQ